LIYLLQKLTAKTIQQLIGILSIDDPLTKHPHNSPANPATMLAVIDTL
jgi:hypothetical protein